MPIDLLIGPYAIAPVLTAGNKSGVSLKAVFLKGGGVAFDSKYFSVSGLWIANWACIYQPLDIHQELGKMVVWLDANPRKAKKKNWHRFIVGWLNRAHAHLVNQQAVMRLEARVGTYQNQQIPDYSKECDEILAKYPDLAGK